jgi:hypothetical protein
MSFDKNIYTAVNTDPAPPISFVQSLDYIATLLKLPIDPSASANFSHAQTALIGPSSSNFFPDQAAADAFFASKTKSQITGLTVDSFFSTTFFPGKSVSDIAALKSSFINDYTNQLHLEDAGWAAIDISSADIENQFGAWFNQFLSGYPFGTLNTLGGGTLPPTPGFVSGLGLQNLLYNASKTMTTTASIALAQVLGGASGLPSYREVFNAFFPGASDADFNANLVAFYDQQVAQNGYFVPSQIFAGWVQAVQGGYSGAVAGGPASVSQSNLSPSNFQKTKVLNDIFALIALMIGTMQKVASSQANRLRILTTWQAAYTYSLQQMHTFVKGDNTSIGGDTPELQTVRTELNTDVNAPKRALIQTYQSNVSDDAKAMQSSINQTSDAVSQQSSIANAIIQELTTLLNAIFR